MARCRLRTWGTLGPSYRELTGLVGLGLVALAAVGAASAAGSPKSPAIAVIADSQLHAFGGSTGGIRPLRATRTVPHWSGSAVNTENGVTYRFTMVGADPSGCGEHCDVTVATDIVPINVVVGGLTFSGGDIVNPVVASPLFALNDYGSTTAATAGDTFSGSDDVSTCNTANGDVCRPEGAGGPLSQGDAGQQLQLVDATMRAQFDRTGDSNYHLRLGHPTIHDPITIVVPNGQGTLLESRRGVIFADVNDSWWTTRIQNLNSSAGLDPTHLVIYLTNSVMLFLGNDPAICCVFGFHGGSGTGASHGNGNEPIQTYAWASWLAPGIFARADGGSFWAEQDIHPLSHEISEWADDPFLSNAVEPWLAATAPQYGCSTLLETGDPVVGIGFAMGKNTFEQGPNPDGSQSADGNYHPEDEAFLPWFMRTSPNDISEANQSGTGGRYTLMGDLNPFAGFETGATDC